MRRSARLRMPAMYFPEKSFEQRGLVWSIVGSLAVHACVLLLPHHPPAGDARAAPRLEARLGPSQVAAEPPSPPRAQPVSARPKRGRGVSSSRLVAAARSPAPTWSVPEKAEMDGFLDELAKQSERATKPTLAERSMAMAREAGRQMARQDAENGTMLELRPNAPPVNPFSLEMYLDAMIRRLNRSAGFARNDPRARGVRNAAVQFRLNPDGSLKSFVVLNAADQAGEIAFIKAVIEQSAPFSPFPPEIDRAARSLGVTICIRPGWGDAGMGFSRTDGRAC